MARLSERFMRACTSIDEAQEFISDAMLPDRIDPVKLRMAARRLMVAAKMIDGKDTGGHGYE
jgi:hypothetical protein